MLNNNDSISEESEDESQSESSDREDLSETDVPLSESQEGSIMASLSNYCKWRFDIKVSDVI